jgi:dihydroorotate dehydrogenase (NAD+) catalytic subunit
VQVGTATFANPTAAETLLDNLLAHLDEIGVAAVSELVGTLESNVARRAARTLS